MKAFLSGVILTLLLLVGIAVVLVSGGYIPISAAGSESSLLRWILHTAYENTLAERAAEVAAPPDLSSETRILAGADSFDSMCAGCHTPPGMSSTAVHTGLNPRAPELKELMHGRSAAEAFWVIDNGVRMTGMPAFGETHDDDQLWALVAFVKAAQNFSGDDYTTTVRKARAKEGGQGHGDHQHRHINQGKGTDDGSAVDDLDKNSAGSPTEAIPPPESSAETGQSGNPGPQGTPKQEEEQNLEQGQEHTDHEH